MAYPPPGPGYPGYPGYPPSVGGAGTYPPQQPSPWVPGDSSTPYPSQPTMPTPGGVGGVLGFGSGPTPTASAGYPRNTATYPPPPATSYPPGPPLPPSQYPSGPSAYPPAPPSQPQSTIPPYGGGYLPPGGLLNQQPPSGGFSQPQQPPVNAPPPAMSHQTPPTHQAPRIHQMATMTREETATSSIHQKTSAAAATSTKTAQEVPTRGTVKPHSHFNAEEDAKELRKAMKGFGTDEKAIINIVAYRSNEQRQQIKLKFKSIHGRDLIADLKSELSSHFEDVVLGLMMTPAEYDASEVYKAIKGLGTDESTLIEVLCTRTNEEILALKKKYKSDYGDIEKDVTSDTSGHFKRFLISMLTGARDRNVDVNHETARSDAQALYRAGEARWGTDESRFNQVLVSRSFAHLRVVFHEYSKICKYDIEQSISREMSGDLKTCMLTVVKCVKDKAAYFAERLYKSMKGLGTDDHTLVRVMVTRSEVDMEDIKDKFYETYRKSLGSFIKGDTSGDYRRILMALARADD